MTAELFAALACAAEIAKRGSNAHVALGSKGFYASIELPPICDRREWLRVRVDGVIEEGATKRVVGRLEELGLR